MTADRARVDEVAIRTEQVLGLPEDSVMFDRDYLLIHIDTMTDLLDRLENNEQTLASDYRNRKDEADALYEIQQEFNMDEERHGR